MSDAAIQALELLGRWSVQVAVVVVAARVATWALRRRAAAVRHTVWAGAIAAMALLPLGGLLLPPLELPSVPLPGIGMLAASERAADATVPGEQGARVSEPVSRATVGDATRLPVDGDSARGGISVAASGLLLAAWGAGVVLALTRLLVGLGRARALRTRSSRIPPTRGAGLPSRTSLGRAVDLRASKDIAVPIAFGLLRPVVLVPADVDRWPAEIRRYALLHEYAHVERLDWGPHLLARALCAFYWFHPLARLAARELVLESERACDDRVLSSGAAAPGYAEQLLVWARRARTGVSTDPAFAIAARAQLRHRIRSILDETQERRPMSTIRTRLLAALVILLGVSASMLGAAAAAPAAAEPPRVVRSQRGAGQGEELTSLMRAAARGDADVVRRLLQRGADANETVRGHGTPLIQAAGGGHANVVEILLAAGADPNLAERDHHRQQWVYRTALTAGARSGDVATLRLLLGAGAEVDRLVPGDPTALMAAAAEGRAEAVRLLLAHGADADRSVDGDGTPLIEAARAGSLEVARLLVEAGADVRRGVAGDGNPLIAAVDSGDVELVRYLLEQGADPRDYVSGDESALVRAAERGDDEMLRLLLAAR